MNGNPEIGQTEINPRRAKRFALAAKSESFEDFIKLLPAALSQPVGELWNGSTWVTFGKDELLVCFKPVMGYYVDLGLSEKLRAELEHMLDEASFPMLIHISSADSYILIDRYTVQRIEGFAYPIEQRVGLRFNRISPVRY